MSQRNNAHVNVCSSRRSARRQLQTTNSGTSVHFTDRARNGYEQFLVHLRSSLGPEQLSQLRDELSGVGAVLGNYLPHNTYLVTAQRSSIGALQQLPGYNCAVVTLDKMLTAKLLAAQ